MQPRINTWKWFLLRLSVPQSQFDWSKHALCEISKLKDECFKSVCLNLIKMEDKQIFLQQRRGGFITIRRGGKESAQRSSYGCFFVLGLLGNQVAPALGSEGLACAALRGRNEPRPSFVLGWTCFTPVITESTQGKLERWEKKRERDREKSSSENGVSSGEQLACSPFALESCPYDRPSRE